MMMPINITGGCISVMSARGAPALVLTGDNGLQKVLALNKDFQHWTEECRQYWETGGQGETPYYEDIEQYWKIWPIVDEDGPKVIAQYRINGVVCQHWVAGSDDLKELSRQIDLCLERLCLKMEDSGADRDYFNQWTCGVSN